MYNILQGDQNALQQAQGKKSDKAKCTLKVHINGNTNKLENRLLQNLIELKMLF